jgi:hypothetical protein
VGVGGGRGEAERGCQCGLQGVLDIERESATGPRAGVSEE